MTPTYWYKVVHYATPEVIREGHHMSIETVLAETKRALEEGWTFECGLD